MKAHKTIIMNLPAEIDIDIAPLVIYLNNLSGVLCCYSCHGEPYVDDDLWQETHQAYVMFTCKRQEILKQIMGLFEDWTEHSQQTVEVRLDYHNKHQFRYTAYWRSNDHLRLFIKWLDLSKSTGEVQLKLFNPDN